MFSKALEFNYILNDLSYVAAFVDFYARKQLLSAHLSHCNSVCPSRGWISQKWCKLGSPSFYRRLPGIL